MSYPLVCHTSSDCRLKNLSRGPVSRRVPDADSVASRDGKRLRPSIGCQGLARNHAPKPGMKRLKLRPLLPKGQRALLRWVHTTTHRDGTCAGSTGAPAPSQ